VTAAARSVCWYDDDTCILRLRDAAAGKEYELDCVSHDQLRQVAPTGPCRPEPGFPPGWSNIRSKIVTANALLLIAAASFIDMRTFISRWRRKIPSRKWPPFYRDTMTRYGLSIERETQSKDWAYSFQARNPERTHEVLLYLLKLAHGTHIRLSDTYTLPRR